MKHFFIITNPLKDQELATTGEVTAFLAGEGCSCQVKIARTAMEGGRAYTDAAEIPEETECILVLGGDGTLIEAARDTVARGIPLLGINLGSLGFLAEVEKNNIRHALGLLIRDQYQTESRMMLNGQLVRGESCVESSYALNDIVITRSGPMQIIHFHLYVNGQFLNEYNADGVILSTPTGSTGYNMSAGGPIVEPGADLIVVTPICPHTLNTRSVVLSGDDEIMIEIAAWKKDAAFRAEVYFDGGCGALLELGDQITVTKSGRRTEIVKISQVSFLEALHKKMSEK